MPVLLTQCNACHLLGVGWVAIRFPFCFTGVNLVTGDLEFVSATFDDLRTYLNGRQRPALSRCAKHGAAAAKCYCHTQRGINALTVLRHA
jgi:hypothetical protein